MVDLCKASARQIAGADPVALVQQQARCGEANAAASPVECPATAENA
jgi:hypothetical protein